MTERPPTILERRNLVIANTEIERKKKADSYRPLKELGSSDFPVLKLRKRQELPQPYGGEFPTYLANLLRAWPYNEVEGHLNVLFPDCDNVDCEYLEEVLVEIRLQKIWAKDRPRYIKTPGSGKLFVANAAKVDKWIKKQRLRLTKEEHVRENPIEATIPFKGTVSALAEALYRLERKGHISLLDYRKTEGNMAALCRTLCRVFILHTTSSKNPALALQLALSKIPSERLGIGEPEVAVLNALGRKRVSKEFIDPKTAEKT
ncbi:hypothetical protein I2I05_13365 [Hymenobacter sp. BT683]|uniref:Uncharacterized protein n=1 Tax=Hymenobacter jeongseonensis TaxID=2791027 RepID=A0ABS0IKJ5_9BACT|nr:hypothetical protein [Hymenobacter jeongseonensis]MBF9238388.1 hypothetical protein [Hymenobacter jeongseonensis]